MSKLTVKKLRADQLLVALGVVETRSRGKDLIKEGVVFCNGKKVNKASLIIAGEIEIRKNHIFVSRGAYKLEAALETFGIVVQDKIIADIGASTGGFTELLLSRGAKKVYAIDVGHGQLATKLLEDKRVINIEKVNIRHGHQLPEQVDLCVVDVSYISLQLVLPEIFNLLNREGLGPVISLFKPQFEVGKHKLGKNGIVKNRAFRQDCLLEFYDWCACNGVYMEQGMVSPIVGKGGNIEYLFCLTKACAENDYGPLKWEQIKRWD